MKPTPQPTGSLRDILERFGTSVSPVATLKNMKNPLVKTENINEALAQLEELISAHTAAAEERLLAKMILDTKTVTYDGEQWNAILVKKLKTITFEQDEEIPKLSNTSNKEENNETRITNL